MNGARALLSTLVANEVTVCFANPGTSEMQFVAALDEEPRMRSVLCLFEGVATGAADGYARMAGGPACTLLHLGPGYANGAANLYNARRAATSIVNVIGDHATYHRVFDAPLNSDIVTLATSNSLWVRSADTAEDVAPLTAEAVAASYGLPGGPVSLILPADAAWNEVDAKPVIAQKPTAETPDPAKVDEIVSATRAADRVVVLLGGAACSEEALEQAARLDAIGVTIFTDTFVARQPRGQGVFAPNRLPYFGEAALDALGGGDLLILVGTSPPVSFFAYPNKPSVLVPDDCEVRSLCIPSEDCVQGLTLLGDALDAPHSGTTQTLALPDAPKGKLNPHLVGQAIARHMPAGAIVCDDGVTSGQAVFQATAGAKRHDWLALTGGAIGIGLPLAIGAAVARPDDKVIALSGDGAAMYTVQALWTMAREQLDVTIVVFANHSYLILNVEMNRTGAGRAGPKAAQLLDLGQPKINWVALAEAQGIGAVRCGARQRRILTRQWRNR